MSAPADDGDRTGLLRLIFHLETRERLGTHIVQAVLTFKGTIDYFVDTVFNNPTRAECYKTAAFDGINRLGRDGWRLVLPPLWRSADSGLNG